MTRRTSRQYRLDGSLQGTSADIAELRNDTSGNRHVSPRRTAPKGRINLKAVAEVLASRGLDPTEAIVDILMPVDPQTGEALPSRLEPDVQARILNELLQYTQPKLKSVEIKAKVAATAFDVSNEQARAIAEEFLRSGAATAALEDDPE